MPSKNRKKTIFDEKQIQVKTGGKQNFKEKAFD